MRVLVCGGRHYHKPRELAKALKAMDAETPFTLLIHGGAPGADSLAGMWADKQRIVVAEYKADWDRLGKSAGMIRNAIMLRHGKPDVVVAFPGGRGTANMVNISKRAGVKVIEISE